MSGEPPLEVRADLADVEPYRSPQRPARYRLNTNESPYPPPRSVLEALVAALEDAELNRYPDASSGELTAALARRHDRSEDGVWVANGSNEVFLHLLLAFGGPGRSALLFEPTYSMHSTIARIAGTNVIRAARDDDFLIDVGRALQIVEQERPEIVFVCSPNNPTGACEPLETVRALVAAAPGLVVVDEAYIDFAAEGKAADDLLRESDKVVLSRTFSKAWRLAGLRVGYLLAAPALIRGIARVGLPYRLSVAAQAAGRAALAAEEETSEMARSIAGERDRLAGELKGMGVHVYPSDSNFMLFRVERAQEVFDALLEEGVLVRSYADHPRLGNHLRVTAGLPEENDAFLRAMKQVVDGL